MLRVYLDLEDIPDNVKVVRDVEKEFASLILKGTEKEKELVRIIEKGELLDSTAFIDRFGYKLYLSELSTGCKAALCVLNSADKVICLDECGLNARDAIILLCGVGAILFDNNSVTISNKYLKDSGVNVQIDKYVFTDIDRLNDYIFNVYPFDFDADGKGVEML